MLTLTQSTKRVTLVLLLLAAAAIAKADESIASTPADLYGRTRFDENYPIDDGSTAEPETPAAFLRRLKVVLAYDNLVSRQNAALQGFIAPHFQLKDATLSEATVKINALLKERNARPGVFKSLLLRVSPAIADAPKGPQTDPHTRSNFGDGKMTLSLTNTSLLEIIRYITNISGAVGDIRPDGIWLVPLSEGIKALFTHSYIVPESICSTRAQAAEIMKTIGAAHYPDRKGEFDEKSHRLTLHMVPWDYQSFDRWYASRLIENRPPLYSMAVNGGESE